MSYDKASNVLLALTAGSVAAIAAMGYVLVKEERR